MSGGDRQEDGMKLRWLLMLAAGWLVAGCGPSVDGLANAYQDNRSQSQRYMAEWPGFAPYLEEDLLAAEAAWKATEGLSGDAQVQAMQAANRAFGPFFVAFSELDELMEEIPDELEDMDRMADGEDAFERRNLWTESDRLVESVRTTLMQARPANRDQALMLVRAQVALAVPAARAAPARKRPAELEYQR